ncbi:P-loop containing nucleoside triphosphate hydrolase protein [Aspergillus pseudoustus]|uniref:P-loop containing nucleoside triphosphate hydrolase protein n=1 Tax=Aspergillus pseudoustus TaxID=1810923 RepID=A0ABR4IZU8_9EURO
MSLARCIFTFHPQPFSSAALSPKPGSSWVAHSILCLVASRPLHIPGRGGYRVKLKHTSTRNAVRKREFIGREVQLKTLEQSLRRTNSPKHQIIVLCGQDGVGKSTLAAQFVHQRGRDFTSVWWVDAASSGTLLSSMARLASRIPTNELLSNFGHGVLGRNALDPQASIVLRYLARKQNSGWLLVLDNLDTTKLLLDKTDRGNSGIDDILSLTKHGSILITTTKVPYGIGAECETIRPLDPARGTEFLKQLMEDQNRATESTDRDDQALKLLVRVLEGLPLAFTLAAAYMRQTGLSPASYLHLYQETRGTIPRVGPREYDPVELACALTLNELQQSNPLAAQLVRLLSCYNHTEIPRGLLNHTLTSTRQQRWLTRLDLEPSGLEAPIQALRDFALLRVDNSAGVRSYTIHRAIHARCRESIDTKEQEKLHSLALVSLGNAIGQALQQSSIVEQQSLLPHADSIRGLLQTSAPLQSDPRILDALKSIASLYESQGLIKEAEGIYLMALEYCDKVLGRCHRTTRGIIRTLRRLRLLQGKMGRLVKGYWWAPLISRGFEILLGGIMILLSLFTWLICLVIGFFSYLLVRSRWRDMEDSRRRELDGDERD